MPDLEAALAGARDICAERVAEDAGLRRTARELCVNKGRLRSAIVASKKGETTKFDNYAQHEEDLSKAPSHRILALLRGETEEVLRLQLALPDDEVKGRAHAACRHQAPGPVRLGAARRRGGRVGAAAWAPRWSPSCATS